MEKRETLIRTRNWSGLYAFEKWKHYMENILEQWPGEKNMGCITSTMGHCPRNELRGDNDPHSWYVMLIKLINNI